MSGSLSGASINFRQDSHLAHRMLAGTSMLIEDVACPVDKLGDMTQDLVDMFQKFGYKDASCFGHALEGNLHLVFSQVWLLHISFDPQSSRRSLYSIP